MLVCKFEEFGDASFEWYTIEKFLVFVDKFVQFIDVSSRAKS